MEGTPENGIGLAINAIAVVISLTTLILITISTARLYGKARLPGTGNMLASLVSAMMGIPGFAIYLALSGNHAGAGAEDVFNLYEVSCVALGAIGYWRLSKAIATRSQAGNDKPGS